MCVFLGGGTSRLGGEGELNAEGSNKTYSNMMRYFGVSNEYLQGVKSQNREAEAVLNMTLRVCGAALHCVALCCAVLHCVAPCPLYESQGVWRCVALCCTVLRCVALCFAVAGCFADAEAVMTMGVKMPMHSRHHSGSQNRNVVRTHRDVCEFPRQYVRIDILHIPYEFIHVM